MIENKFSFRIEHDEYSLLEFSSTLETNNLKKNLQAHKDMVMDAGITPGSLLMITDKTENKIKLYITIVHWVHVSYLSVLR